MIGWRKVPTQDISLDYQSMATIYVKQNRLQLAMTYYKKAKPLLDSTRDLVFLIMSIRKSGQSAQRTDAY